MPNAAHTRGLIEQDDAVLIKTEGTPYTAETFASTDYWRHTGGSFEYMSEPADLGEMLGGTNRGGVMEGATYGVVNINSLMRRPTDTDDGPPAAELAAMKAARMAVSTSAGVSHTLTATDDESVIEAARVSLRIDKHGDQYNFFGGLNSQWAMDFRPGMPVRQAFTFPAILSATFATHHPAEDNPASRTPALTWAGSQSNKPFVCKNMTVQGFGTSNLIVRDARISVQNGVVPIPSLNSANHAYAGCLSVDNLWNVELGFNRPLQSVVKLDELWFLDNSQLAGTAVTLTLTCNNGTNTATRVITLTGFQQVVLPQTRPESGIRVQRVSLRKTGTANITIVDTVA